MLKERRSTIEILFLIFDLLIICGAWFLAYWFRFYSGIFSTSKGIPSFSIYVEHLWLVIIIWAFVFRHLRLYHSQRLSSVGQQLWLLIKANTLATLILLALTYLGWGKSDPFSRLTFGWFWIFSIILSFVGRVGIRAVMRELRRQGYNIKYVLLVGESEASKVLIKKLNQVKELGYEVIGILVTDNYDENDFHGVKVVGKLENLTDVIASYKVDTVIVTLPISQMHNIEDLVSVLTTTHVDIKIIPDVASIITVGGSVEEFDGLPIISVQECPIQGFEFMLKRVFDIVVAGAGLVFLCPVFLLIALGIKVTSRGPIFYSQDRVTLDGTKFKIWKFRTMKVDAEKDVPQWSTRNDPRVTKFGRFLRAWSLDELPQLWNVLKGDMSLVGPRPERPYFIKQFRHKIPTYMLRHKVPAGLTGLAQVNGLRGDTSIEERLKYDLLYIKNWSFFLDLKIILQTLIKGFRNKQV
ncbi:MAG: undecaprenyl-phosphate glucose phosphotransferase [Deltaproteobacteria bacterium]|nr:undecaprenyl-phosphate glucose phosphotransferase [Deltaproteobacteria bacterium]